jgi:hypothetical protein
MGVYGSSVATSIFALDSLGISTIKLKTPSPKCSGISCQGETCNSKQNFLFSILVGKGKEKKKKVFQFYLITNHFFLSSISVQAENRGEKTKIQNHIPCLMGNKKRSLN